MKIYDAMVEAAAKARADGRKPRRWELNYAGYFTLVDDGRVSRDDWREDGPPTFFDIPWDIDHADKSLDPKFRLIVDEVAAEYVGEAGRRIVGMTADEFRPLFNKDRMLPVLLLDGELTVPVGLNGENVILHGQKGEFPLAWFKPNPLSRGIFQFAWEGTRYDLPPSLASRA